MPATSPMIIVRDRVADAPRSRMGTATALSLVVNEASSIAKNTRTTAATRGWPSVDVTRKGEKLSNASVPTTELHRLRPMINSAIAKPASGTARRPRRDDASRRLEAADAPRSSPPNHIALNERPKLTL